MEHSRDQTLRITLFEAVANPSLSLERYSHELSSALAMQDRVPLQVTRYRPPQPRLLDRAQPVTRHIPLMRFYAQDCLFASYVTYPFLARRHQKDVNHILHHHEAHLLRWLNPARTIVTCHDLMPMYFNRLHPDRSRAYRLFEYSVRWLRRAARVISVSEVTKRALVEYLGLVEERIRVVPNGVGPPFAPVENSSLLDDLTARYRLPKGRKVLHAGVTHAQKNIETLLRALSILTKSMPDITLVKTGSDLTIAQRDLARELGIGDRVVSLGIIPLEDLARLYALCDVLVLPSFHEGFGLPIIEAFACGTPVVASDIEAAREVAGEAALLVTPFSTGALAEAMEAVLAREQLRRRLVAQGFKQAHRFSWAEAARRLAVAYEEVTRAASQSNR